MNPMNKTPNCNCDSLKKGIMSPVIAACDLSEHSVHPESWKQLWKNEKEIFPKLWKSGKILFSVYSFLIKQKKQNFSRSYHRNTLLSVVSDVAES